jgi:uncharacterized protein YbbK (DUF523 family)
VFDLDKFCGASEREPLTILCSACLLGRNCGSDGTCYGFFELPRKIAQCANVKEISFCPEELVFGTPRENFSIHDGDGFDVLDGRARVITNSGKDWTEPAVESAKAMLRFATENNVQLAIMMDISPSCGSRVIYKGDMAQRVYQASAGVAAALLLRNGISIFTQRDFRYLDLLLRKLDSTHVAVPNAVNHFEDEWYRNYF